MLAPAPALADGTDPGWHGSVLHVSIAGPRVADVAWGSARRA